ncbi:MAG: hypothetical protein CMJ78_12395 [Planctomycetaceae bacterium]|nr:hypothetical protein [Planctomycetaceae bacterium]
MDIESSGGVALLVGDAASLTGTIQNSTFSQNAGNDILAAIGDELPEDPNGTINVTIAENTLGNNRTASTLNGNIATGIRTIADAGTANFVVSSNVLTGDSALTNSQAIFLRSQKSNATLLINSNGLNPNGGIGNEISGWIVGVNVTAENGGNATVDVFEATIDAKCVLKFHSRQDGVLNSSINDTVMIANVQPTETFDAIFLEGFNNGVLNIDFNNSIAAFSDPGLISTEEREFIYVEASDSSTINFSIDELTVSTAMNAFDDFIRVQSTQSSTITGQINNSVLGATRGNALHSDSFETSRVTLNVSQTGFIGNQGNGLDVEAGANSTVIVIADSNDFQALGGNAIRLAADSETPTEDSRLDVTLSNNNVLTTNPIIINSESTNGMSQVLANVIGNQSVSTITLDVDSNGGTATLTGFDDGNNTPTPTNNGTTSPTLLDLVFP